MGSQIFLERFCWFDNKIRSNRYPNARKLEEQFEINKKTAQRSIDFFRDRLFAPLEYSYKHKGYLYSDPDFQLPVVQISENELMALLVSRKLLSEASAGSLGDELGGVSKKIGSIIEDKLLGPIKPEDAFSFRWKNFNPTEPEIFKLSTSALLRGNLLTFSYKPPRAKKGVIRTVEPHHMVNYMGNWHLIAYCHLRQGWRDFVLARMSKVTMPLKTFTFRPMNEWQTLLVNTFGIYQNPQRFEVVLRFSPDRANWIKDEIWHEQQEILLEDDGSLTLKLPASHEAEISMEILKHGSHVKVLQPAWLQKSIGNELKNAATNYT